MFFAFALASASSLLEELATGYIGTMPSAYSGTRLPKKLPIRSKNTVVARMETTSSRTIRQQDTIAQTFPAFLAINNRNTILSSS